MSNFQYKEDMSHEALFARLKEQGVESQIRLLTSEDELVCTICGPADHKLKDAPISAGDWNGRSWGQRFPAGPPFHDGCRCQAVVEKANSLKEEVESEYLDSIGKHIEAAEIRYQRALKSFGKSSLVMMSHGRDFMRVGANKRAWELFSEGVKLAQAKNESPHQIREAMAELLVLESKTEQAAGFLLLGIEEAEKLIPSGAPKSLITSLKKTVKLLGLKDKSTFEEIIATCKSQGAKKSFELLKSLLLTK